MTQAATLLEQAGDSAMKQKVKDVEEAFGFNPAPFSLEAIVSSKQFPRRRSLFMVSPALGKRPSPPHGLPPSCSVPKTAPELLTFLRSRRSPAPSLI